MILSFQDEMRQIEETRIASAQKNLKKLEPEKYRPCIETLCECAKEDLRAAVRLGKLRYQEEKKTYRYDWEGNAELLSEVKRGPLYLSHWFVRCEIDFSSEIFRYDKKNVLFQVNDVDALLYVLAQMEKQLRKDDIICVDFQESTRDNSFLWRRTIRYEYVRTHILNADCCEELREISAARKKGSAETQYVTMLNFNFAYFVP